MFSTAACRGRTGWIAGLWCVLQNQNGWMGLMPTNGCEGEDKGEGGGCVSEWVV
jgi:hypothetical protein